MKLSTATPAEIDAELARIFDQMDRTQHTRDINRRIKAKSSDEYQRRKAQDTIRDCDQALETLHRASSRYIGEFTRRGGWNRLYLVTNANGHAHSSTDCQTCFPTTQMAWLTEYSGKTEDEIVAAAGEKACTTCYPSAPVDALRRATKLEDPERRAARIERERKAAERAAATAAKAITFADGSPVHEYDFGTDTFIGPVIKTERTAQIAYVEAVVDAAEYADPDQVTKGPNESSAEHVDHCKTIHGRESTTAEYLLGALAYKSGMTINEKRADLEPKVKAKMARRKKEVEDLRKRGLIPR